MKKFLILLSCAILLLPVGAGSFPRSAHAGGVIEFLAAPLSLIDPLTMLVIVDAFTCKVNVIWGCDKNGDPLPEPLPTITLTVPTTIELPNPITLNWSANARAVSCVASGDWSGAKILSGSESIIAPTGPASLGAHTYSLSCKNSEGNSATATASTNVIGPSVSITGPGIVEVPNPIPLNWTSQNTVSCAATGRDWSGSKTVSGNETVASPTNTGLRGVHTYGLTCINGSNYSASASAAVTVIQVPKCSRFTATPGVITPPQSAQLEWSCEYAVSCSIDHGVGVVNPVTGLRKVSPPATTAYTLNCQGVDGTRTFQTTIGIPGTGGVPLPGGATTTPRIHEVNP